MPSGAASRRAPPRAPTLAGLLGTLLLLAQLVVAVRVLGRLLRTAGGSRIIRVERRPAEDGTVSVIVPVLDERDRLAPCLEGLITQGPELAEILVVDGGSADGTPALVQAYAARDPRLRLVDASPIPGRWNGKAWGLQIGLERAAPSTSWLLTVDADVRPGRGLVPSLLAQAARAGLGVVSVATRQQVPGPGVGLIHPALLATLVYRFGIPGHATRDLRTVQANGQCMLIRRDRLAEIGGFAVGRSSVCEDVTIARRLALAGCPSGFYEVDEGAGDLVSVRMYEGGWEAYRNWTRSLPMRDHLTRWSALVGLAEATLVQAAPLVIVTALGLAAARAGQARDRSGAWLIRLNLGLLAARLGILVGTRRAYEDCSWTFWLSPLLDGPAVVQLWWSALARRHTWRGRTLDRELVCGEDA